MESDPEPRTRLTPGRMVGHYRIESWVGEGAMGVVYRAFDTHLDRPVAIKVLRAESTAHPERRRRFVQEAKAASALNHPNIITIYDIGSADGIDYIAMEFVDGRTLGSAVDRGGLGWSESVNYAIQIVDALSVAHAAGLVHRDLKPANIMIASDGLVKVLDFGLAKLAERVDASHSGIVAAEAGSPTQTADPLATPRTETGAAVGTLAYMSPEQAEGKPVDARSDVFSFGSVLYEMLTGRQAFKGETKLAVLAAILHEQPEPVRSVAPQVPPELEQILDRCLRKDRDRRYQSMADLRLALIELRESGSQILPRLRSRRRLTAAALALAAGAAWATWSWRSGPASSPGGAKRIAVLRFENIGADPVNQAFCDGLVEDLTSKLTQLERFQGSLGVVPASEVRREGAASAADARRSFAAALVITGSVHRAGDQVRITANLVDAATQAQLQSRSITFHVEQLLSLQDRVVQEIVPMLDLHIQPQTRVAIAAGGAASPGAYDFYLQGRGYLQNYDKPENIDNALTVLERALQLDPKFALAHAGLGEARWRKYERTKEASWVASAREGCEQSLRLNTKLAAGRICLGTVEIGTGQYEKATEEFQRALDEEPLNDDAWRGLGRAQELLGRYAEAEATYRRAIQVRPQYWGGYTVLGSFLSRRERHQEAAEQYRQVIALTPDNNRAYYSLGGIYIRMGRYEDAIAPLRRAIELRPTYQSYSNLGIALLRLRRPEEAVTNFERALQLGPGDYVVSGNLASAYYQSPGKRERAIEMYTQAARLARKRLEINPRDADALVSLARYQAMLGARKDALASLNRALELNPKDSEYLVYAAIIYNQFGEREAAITYVEKAVARGYSSRLLASTPELDNLRNDPKLLALLRAR